jgi:hypothetical protein
MPHLETAWSKERIVSKQSPIGTWVLVPLPPDCWHAANVLLHCYVRLPITLGTLPESCSFVQECTKALLLSLPAGEQSNGWLTSLHGLPLWRKLFQTGLASLGFHASLFLFRFAHLTTLLVSSLLAVHAVAEEHSL